jgi:hypothetical protein
MLWKTSWGKKVVICESVYFFGVAKRSGGLNPTLVNDCAKHRARM